MTTARDRTTAAVARDAATATRRTTGRPTTTDDPWAAVATDLALEATRALLDVGALTGPARRALSLESSGAAQSAVAEAWHEVLCGLAGMAPDETQRHWTRALEAARRRFRAGAWPGHLDAPSPLSAW